MPSNLYFLGESFRMHIVFLSLNLNLPMSLYLSVTSQHLQLPLQSALRPLITMHNPNLAGRLWNTLYKPQQILLASMGGIAANGVDLRTDIVAFALQFDPTAPGAKR